MRSRWQSLGRQDAGLEHGKEEGMNGQTNVCLCGVWSCQPAAPSISLAKALKSSRTSIQNDSISISNPYILWCKGSNLKQSITIHTPNNFWIFFLFCFFFLTGSHLAKAILECLILQWSEIPGVYYCAWLPALASSLFKRQGLTR